MGFGPRLPENAPFTASQRAWLDGYIACWFSFESARNGEPSPPPMQAELGDFPWHDPTLSLEERLALAEGRKPERVGDAATRLRPVRVFVSDLRRGDRPRRREKP